MTSDSIGSILFPSLTPQGLLHATASTSSYSSRKQTVVVDVEGGGASPELVQSTGSAKSTGSAGRSSQFGRARDTASTSAKPIKQFQFLTQKYSVETPSCLIPRLNELFKSVCERYDIAVTNREKVDEALTLFKKVLEVDINLPMVQCFQAWREQLVNPTFNVVTKEPTGDVKQITVRAEEVPQRKRKAQKHIRDLLDACHLFLQQREFLQRQITNDLAEIDQLAKDLPALFTGVHLSSSEKKQMPQVVKRARDQFAKFPSTIDMFWNQIYSLVHEINTSVYVLQDD